MSARPGATIPTAAEIAAIHSARKVAAVRQAKRAPFFRGKLDHIDLDRLDDPAEWAKIPLLDKDMLRSMSDAQFYRDFCLPPARGRWHCPVLALRRHHGPATILSAQPPRH